MKQFDHSESGWQLFYSFLYLVTVFREYKQQLIHYGGSLDAVLEEKDGQILLPEVYFVPEDCVEQERLQPGSQIRIPNNNVPLVWAQSLYLLGCLLEDGLLRLGDLDPLGRRHHKIQKKPVVQLMFLAEDKALQQELEAYGVPTQTLTDISPVQVYRPEDIATIHAQIGKCEALGLSGRIPRKLKSLTTSRVYMMGKQRAICLTPSFIQKDFFLSYDIEFLVRRFKSELSYLHRNWTELGRPTVTVLLTHNLLNTDRSAFYALMKQIASGEVDGIPVRHDIMAQLLNTAAVEHVEHLQDLVLPEQPLDSLLTQSCVLELAGEHKQLSPGEELEIALQKDSGRLEAKLAQATNLYKQIALLTKLVELQSIDTKINIHNQQRSLHDLIEEVYTHAGRLRLWSVLRQASGLQGKINGDIGLAVGDLLVAQKFIQVGRSYHDGSLITRPLNDEELMQKIVQYCREDVRDRILTQEVLLYLGLLIKARPELFSELLTLRVSLLIILLTSQIARAQNNTTVEAYEILMNLPPSEIQSRLGAVLENYQSLADLPQKLETLHAQGNTEQLNWQQNLGLEQLETPVDGWLAWRQHQGILDRRSADFLTQIWRVLKHTNGLVIGNKMDKRNRISSDLVLSDMTEGEKAFALLIEHMFNTIHAAEYRQLTIETLTALASFFEQNPSLIVEEAIVIDVTIGHAVNLAYVKEFPERKQRYNEHKSHAWERFYQQSPVHSTTFIISALNHLLTVRQIK